MPSWQCGTWLTTSEKHEHLVILSSVIDDIITLVIFSLAQSAETSALRTLAVKSANPHLSRSCDLGLLSLLKDARFLSWNYCGSNSHLIDFFQSRWKALMHVAFIGGSYHEVTLRRRKRHLSRRYCSDLFAWRFVIDCSVAPAFKNDHISSATYRHRCLIAKCACNSGN